MDTYLDFPVKDREDFEKMKEHYDPHDPRRYPANWPQIVEHYRERDVPLCLVQTAVLVSTAWRGSGWGLRESLRHSLLSRALCMI